MLYPLSYGRVRYHYRGMGATGTAEEVEIKLAVADAGEARARLERGGFAVVKPRLLEVNTVYDDPADQLFRGQVLLRLRRTGEIRTLTFKGPPQPGKHKRREELELTLSDDAACDAILDRLGYTPRFRYEKYRTEYQAADREGTATLDETPIGVYLELEGPPHWIDRTAATLGFSEADYLTASYYDLFTAWRERTASTARHMVFASS
jgi:adenylate cyclase, class 2